MYNVRRECRVGKTKRDPGEKGDHHLELFLFFYYYYVFGCWLLAGC